MLVPVADERPAVPQNTDELRSKALQGPPKVTASGDEGSSPLRGVAWLWAPAAVAAILPLFRVSIGLSTLVAALVAAVSVAVSLAAERKAERRRERTRTTLDKEVYDVVKPTETALTTDAEQELTERLDQLLKDERTKGGSTASVTVSATIRRRMRQRIISDNELRTELDRAVLEVLPPSPRAAKRMFNHAHLLLDIGVERGIFATQPGLKASQLATWVALTERWPSVAAAITSDPTLLGQLEEIAVQQTVHLALRPEQLTAMENDIGITGLDSSLLDYLRRSDSLMPCVHLLVNFSPGVDEEAASDAQASVTSADSTAGP